MAKDVRRSRNIKPGICTSETLLGTTLPARLLFSWLPMFADCEGRLRDRPVRLKAQMFPYDDGITAKDVNNWLCELASLTEASGAPAAIIRYSAEGDDYIQIVNFRDHQKPHKQELAQGSEIPPYQPDTCELNAPLGKVRNHFGTTSEAVALDSLIPGYLGSSIANESLFQKQVDQKAAKLTTSIYSSREGSTQKLGSILGTLELNSGPTLEQRLRKQVIDWATWGDWYRWALSHPELQVECHELIQRIEDAADEVMRQTKGCGEFENPGQFFVAKVRDACRSRDIAIPSKESLARQKAVRP